jgi:hypothetical protein
MTRQSFVLISLIALLAAGTVFAADQPAPPVSDTRPVLVTQEVDTAVSVGPPPTLVPEDNRKPPHVFGLGIGSYTPINSEVKDVFGGTKLRIGLRPILTETPERARFMYDVSFYSLWKDDDRAILIPLTVGLIKGFGQDTKTQTYAAINAGTFYGKVEAPSVGVSDSGWGFTANASVGLIYNKRFMLEGRYEIMNEFAGFKFDSFSVLAAYKLLQWRF